MRFSATSFTRKEYVIGGFLTSMTSPIFTGRDGLTFTPDTDTRPFLQASVAIVRVLKIREAEAYDGPSLIIAYAPCINHGLKKGMGKSQAEEAAAVECGYWHLWRYNPELEKEGKNPFTLDSKEPNWDNFTAFLKGEVRYASVMKAYPNEAEQLFEAAKENAQWRYNNYRRLALQHWGQNPDEIELKK